MHLPIAKCLEIAELGNYHPLEIILSLEYERAKNKDKEIIKEMYWIATIANVADRMAARCYSRKHYNYLKKRGFA